jgi:hypothetical protein
VKSKLLELPGSKLIQVIDQVKVSPAAFIARINQHDDNLSRRKNAFGSKVVFQEGFDMQNKRASSFNALKTGAYARQSLLPWRIRRVVSLCATEFSQTCDPSERLRPASPSILWKIGGFEKDCGTRAQLRRIVSRSAGGSKSPARRHGRTP